MKQATEADVQPIAAVEGQVVIPTEEDYEARVASLEAEKAKLIEEKSNYQVAYLKEKGKKKADDFEDGEESLEDKMRRISNEALANSKLAQIAYEQDQIIKKALKENKELKLAQMNRGGTPPAAAGSHSESQPIRDTLVTADQMAAFKARGWTEKDIERYKKNLQRYAR